MDREHQTQDCRYRHQERLRKFLRFNSATRVRRAMTGLYPCKLSVLREIRRRDNGKGVTRKKRGERRHDRTRET